MLCQELVKGIAVGSFFPPKTSESAQKKQHEYKRGVFITPFSKPARLFCLVACLASSPLII